MSHEPSYATMRLRDELDQTAVVFHPLEEQYRNLEEQHEAGALGMWVFLATEVMFFGALFLGLGAYHILYGPAFEKASEKLNWIIGGLNTIVLLVSSLFMVLAVHYAKHGNRSLLTLFLGLTALLGGMFLVLKGFEYYTDYRDNLIPGWRFDDQEWIKDGLTAEQVPQVKLFLIFYWVMTALHGVHVTVGIIAVLVLLWLARRGTFTPAYYSPVDVTALYWHFVDTVWIFLLPMLYLLGTHNTLTDLHIL
jgi:cytochrome c oxidase subunit III